MSIHKPTKFSFDLECGHHRKSDKKHAENLYCFECDDMISVKKRNRNLFAGNP